MEEKFLSTILQTVPEVSKATSRQFGQWHCCSVLTIVGLSGGKKKPQKQNKKKQPPSIFGEDASFCGRLMFL